MSPDEPRQESDDARERPDGAEAPAQKAEETLETLRAERDDLRARLQRVSADYLNYQKRAARDVQTAREFANEELIKALLAVIDDMERALAAARQNHDESDPLLAGMQLVHDKFMETLGRYGLTRIEAEGKKFNPDEHSAVMQQVSDEHEPMTVLQEVQKGFQLKGRTIRPATVIVSKRPEAEEED